MRGNGGGVGRGSGRCPVLVVGDVAGMFCACALCSQQARKGGWAAATYLGWVT